MADTDKDWEEFARRDPYYSVLTRQEFAGIEDDSEAKARFFRSGEEHVVRVMERLSETPTNPHTDWEVLDFGCGVGRLLVPFAQQCRFVAGVDISPSMLQEARRNLEHYGLSNATVCRLDELPSSQRFDLVHSTIVFQHIPVKRGMKLFGRLLDLLKPEGRIALHFTFARNYSHSELGWKLASRFPTLIPWFRLLKLENPFEKRMLMMRYDLNEILRTLHQRGIGRLTVDTVDDQGNLGAVIYGQA